jgi:hypothetical protein
MEYLCRLMLFLRVNLILDDLIVSSNSIPETADAAVFVGCLPVTVCLCFVAGDAASSCAPDLTLTQTVIVVTNKQKKPILAQWMATMAGLLDIDSGAPGNIEGTMRLRTVPRKGVIIR